MFGYEHTLWWTRTLTPPKLIHSNAFNNVWHHFGKFSQSKIVNPEFMFGTKILLPAGKRARQYTNWNLLKIRVS
jgi:hypothetical protein